MRSLVKSVAFAAAVTAAVAAAGSLTACGSSSSSGGANKQVRLYISGDVNVRDLWQKDLIPGFQRANKGYSVKVIFSEHGVNDTQTLARIGTSVQRKADPGFDLVEGGPAATVAQRGWAATPTAAKVPNLAGVPKGLITPAKGKAVPYRGTTVVLGYNTKYVKSPPKTLKDLTSWIKAHPGKFAYNTPDSGGSGQSFVVTVLDQHVPAGARNKLVNTDDTADEKYWDKGLKELKGLKSSMYQKTYTDGNQGTLDLLGKANIWMAPVWVDQTLTGIANGSLPKTTKMAQISDPSFTGGAVYLAAPKSSNRQSATFKLMNYVLTTTAQQQIVSVLSGFPAVSLSKLSSAVQAKFTGLSNTDFRLTYQTDVLSDLNQQWQQNVA